MSLISWVSPTAKDVGGKLGQSRFPISVATFFSVLFAGLGGNIGNNGFPESALSLSAGQIE